MLGMALSHDATSADLLVIHDGKDIDAIRLEGFTLHGIHDLTLSWT